MDKLEQYLDQVCRGLGGSRAMRQHVRQELREHLLDAAAEHKAAGLPEEQALTRALEDFGGTEQVRSELEATHGYRLMPLVIDKAIEWKERTMKAKWLWTSWAYLALVFVLVLEVLWISFANVYLVPRFQKLMQDGLIDPRALEESGISWMAAFLQNMSTVGSYATFLLLGAAVSWGLFEWRVRSENKPLMRFSTLGTAAVGLTLLSVLMGAALVIPYQMTAPATARLVRPMALRQINALNASVSELEVALAKKDWEVMHAPVDRALYAVNWLGNTRLALSAIANRQEALLTMDQLRGQLNSVDDCLHQVQAASQARDAERLKAALQSFRQHSGLVSAAARGLEK
jgi:hypothetical protein